VEPKVLAEEFLAPLVRVTDRENAADPIATIDAFVEEVRPRLCATMPLKDDEVDVYVEATREFLHRVANAYGQ
jgi:hypothetical protein